MVDTGLTENGVEPLEAFLLNRPSDGIVKGDPVGACSVPGSSVEPSDADGAIVGIDALDALSASV